MRVPTEQGEAPKPSLPPVKEERPLVRPWLAFGSVVFAATGAVFTVLAWIASLNRPGPLTAGGTPSDVILGSISIGSAFVGLLWVIAQIVWLWFVRAKMAPPGRRIMLLGLVLSLVVIVTDIIMVLIIGLTALGNAG